MDSILDSSKLHFKEVVLFRKNVLGSGAFGMVCRAKCDQLPCAAKVLHSTFVDLQGQAKWVSGKFAQECAFLSSIKHPNIVQFLGVHEDADGGQVALLMELMDESLTMFLERLEPEQAVPLHVHVDICYDVSLALNYLHNNGIIHRDLSSNNVLLVAGRRAKITDFGMSKLVSSSPLSSVSSLTQVPGCPVYMPPEAWLSPPVYTEKLDIFSLGVLMIQIATRKHPNPGPSEVLIPDERSPTGFLKLPVPEVDRRESDISLVSLEHPLQATMRSCLSDKPECRPSSKELCQTLENIIATSEQYKLSSCNKYELGAVSKETVSSNSQLQAQLEQKESGLCQSKLEVSDLKEKVRNLEEQVSSKDVLISELNDKLKRLEELKEKFGEPKEKPEESKEKSHESVHEMTLSGLSPEILSIIARDRSTHVFNVRFDVEAGQVNMFAHRHLENIQQNLLVFLQVYQHLFNTGRARVEFVPVPDSFPNHLTERCAQLCHMEHSTCIFQFLEPLSIFKVIAKSPELINTSVKMLRNTLNLCLTLETGQVIQVKKGNIINEKASIIVSAANPLLTHRLGLSAAINAASGLEVQEHCNAYIKKHGPLLNGQVALTKAGGSLQCDWIIHAVGTGGISSDQDTSPAFKKQIEKVMTTVVKNILIQAEKAKARSIAIPAIGTGNLGLSSKLAASFILNALTEYEYSSSSSLVDIRVVLLTDEVFTAFAERAVELSGLLNSWTYLSHTKPQQKKQKAGTSASTKDSATPPSSSYVTEDMPTSCKHQ